jgi:integrative and conjugative element protein (TIGR02256 family)
MNMEAPGASITISELTIPKALALSSYLNSGKHPYATLIDIRRDAASGVETVVFDVVVELSQTRVNQILERERLATSFLPADDVFPEVVALRDDFPWVPHLNQREVEFPRSLCLYELPYTSVRLRWTPTLFVERIRQWLSLTSEGKLHQDDQPLENVFLGQFPPLILPSDFIKSALESGNGGQGAIRFGVHAVGDDPQRITGFVVTNPKMHSVPVRPDHVVTAVIAPARKHGLIRQTPQNLRQVIDVMNEVDVDLLSILRQRLRQWKDNDATIVGARVLLLLIFPKYREEASPQETWEWDTSGFLLIDPVQELGVHLGLWQVMPGGTLATLIGAEEDHSTEALVQIVNPVTQLTKARAAVFNGTNCDDRKLVMVGVGALGSMTLQNLVRKGFGIWSIVDDDLMMPHNGARHALPALAAGAPKVTGMKQMMETIYEEMAVTTAGRINILRPGTEEATLSTILGEADVILDCSADVPAARQLALDSPGPARRLSLFLSPDGEQMVMLLEDKNREIKLDSLEMQFYQLLLASPSLQGHYASLGPKIRYGRSCRDLSAILSADSIAAFAGIGSKAAELLLRDDAAAIAVWKLEADISIRATWARPRREFRLRLPSFTVVWDEGVLNKMRWLRGERLPRETGGALLGCWDLSRSILYIVDVTGAPEDSLERATAFIRGSKSLSGWIAAISRISGGAIEYVGEWHSHPNGYSTNPSGDDRKVFDWIDEHLSVDGLPPAMLIVGETELRWMSAVDGNGVAWKYPN